MYHIYRYMQLKALGLWLVGVYQMLLDTNTQTQAVTACTKTHTETPTCPTERPCQSDTSGFRLKKKREREETIPWREGRMICPQRLLDSPVKWLAILAVGLGGRAGGCLRRDSCFTGVSSWSPEKAAGFLGGSSRTGLAEGSWDRRTPDSLAEGLSSDTEGTTTWHTGDITQMQCRCGWREHTGQGCGLATQQSTDCSRLSRMCEDSKRRHQKSNKVGIGAGHSEEAEAEEGEVEGARGRKRKRTFSQNYPKLYHFNLGLYKTNLSGVLKCDSWDHSNNQQMAGVADQGQRAPSDPNWHQTPALSFGSVCPLLRRKRRQILVFACWVFCISAPRDTRQWRQPRGWHQEGHSILLG